MQDGNNIPADEAGQWLRENLKDETEPRVDITLIPGDPSPVAYQEVLEILFGPPTG